MAKKQVILSKQPSNSSTFNSALSYSDILMQSGLIRPIPISLLKIFKNNSCTAVQYSSSSLCISSKVLRVPGKQKYDISESNYWKQLKTCSKLEIKSAEWFWIVQSYVIKLFKFLDCLYLSTFSGVPAKIFAVETHKLRKIQKRCVSCDHLV